MIPWTISLAIACTLAANVSSAQAAEGEFIGRAASLGDDHGALSFSLAAPATGGSGLGFSTLRATVGVGSWVQYGLRASAAKERDGACLAMAVVPTDCRAAFEYGVSFEVDFALWRSPAALWAMELALFSGPRYLGGAAARMGALAGIAATTSVRLGQRGLAFATLGYQATYLGSTAAYIGDPRGFQQARYAPENQVNREPLLRHEPMLSVGLEAAVGALHPFAALNSGIQKDPFISGVRLYYGGTAGLGFLF